MEKTEPPRRRNPYRIRADRVWALIRPRYLRGESAPRLAEVFNVTEYAIRQRIRREGWSKRALAEAEAAGMPEPEEALAELAAEAEAEAAGTMDGAERDARAAARLALDRAVGLMRAGQMSGAAEAARVADVMARAAARLDGDGPADPGEPDQAAFEAVRRKVLGWDEPAGPPLMGEEDHPKDGGGGLSEAPARLKTPSTASRSPSPEGGGFE
jgi:hypothetical protein